MKNNILSNRVNNLTESATLEMTRRSRMLKSQGYDVITLSIGEPDFNTPEAIKDEAKIAIDNNKTHYTPVSGLPELREAIVEKLKRDNDLDYDVDQIVVSNGAKQSIANIILCLINPGDEVIIPSPFWVSYPEFVHLAEGKVVEIPTTINSDFKVTAEQLEKAITEKTKAIIFSSPSNPTGMLYSEDELRKIAEVVSKHKNIIIISDEIYEYINFSGKHRSIAEFDFVKEQVVVINGVSKGYAMTGWRIGYAAAPKFLAKACDIIQGQYTSGASSISQLAALKAMQISKESSEEIQNMLKAFKERRDLVYELLCDIPGIKANMPDGAFYFFPEVNSYYGKSNGKTTIKNSKDFCMYILENVHVALVPGSAFGNPDCVRVSYATSNEKLIEAMKRIKSALAKLK
ncbi:MAG: pyridoxal phosphate-dependent aminotransferase [Bacteroidales bacterium]|nr:pyridoxal phosphate-dependent aminotransferase [Bacteroidales bacterium]